MMRRRRLIRLLSMPSMLGVAGCAGDEGDDGASDTATSSPSDEATESTEEESGTGSPTESASDSVFSDAEISGVEFVVTLNMQNLDDAEWLRVTYPNKDDLKGISAGIDTYRFRLVQGERVEVRPGTWDVETLTNTRQTIDATDFDAERNWSLASIGTLAENDVKDEDEYTEYTTLQFTVGNVGSMPVSFVGARLTASFFDERADRLTDGVGVVEAGEESTSEPMFEHKLGFGSQSEAENHAGNSYQGALRLETPPASEETIPLTITFGEEVNESQRRGHYIKPTMVDVREE